jgi:hypothetical protein
LAVSTFPLELDQLLGGDVGAQLGELLVLLVADVVVEDIADLPHDLHELGAGGVGALELLHQLLELLVLLGVVLDRLVAVGQVVAHRGIDVHLLGDRVTHQLADQLVGQLPAALGVDGDRDQLEQLAELDVVGGEDVDHVAVGAVVGHGETLRNGCGRGISRLVRALSGAG